MQRLEFFQSLWAMEQRIPGQAERPVDAWLDDIVEAGYHGVSFDPSVAEIPQTREWAARLQALGLKCMVNAFPASANEMRPLLELAVEIDAVMVNAIGAVMPLTVDEGAGVVRRWMEEAERLGMPLLFETHRDCTLNDLYYTLQLMDAVPEMRLCADLSHYVIDREMRLPLSERDAAFMRRVLRRSDAFQGRVANREQIQVQIDFPQHQDWVQQFRDWWAYGLREWRSRAGPDDTLVFLCELGPPPYAMTDANQRELSNRWDEALTIRRWVEETWSHCG